MSDIARELSRRATPGYVGERAKETALNKTVEWKDQLFASPTALGIIGGTIGALIGRSLAKERSTRTTYAYRSHVLDERGTPYIAAAEAVGNVRDRASDALSNVRDHLPSSQEIAHTADENPMMVALGGLALGAVAALLLPVSRKERDLLDPVKQRAGEAIGSLGEKLGDTVHEAQQKIEGKPPDASGFDTTVAVTH